VHLPRLALLALTSLLSSPLASADAIVPAPNAAAAAEVSAEKTPVTEASAEKTPTEPFQTQGIYLQQYTAQTPKRLDRLIDRALDVGINTLVVDLETRQAGYKKAIEHIHERGLRYVPRIVMFNQGGNRELVNNRAFWEERWKLAEYALELGAKDIQLDYIRYSSKTPASPQNALDVREVLRFFRKRINERGARLQIDVFGEVGYAPSMHIGQDISLFAPEIDAVCPMTYPSHYEPFAERAQQPFETVHSSLVGLQRQMGASKVPVLPYIELFNYRYKLNPEQRINYIREQLRAAREASAEGWIAWSAGNRYEVLFDVLRQDRARSAAEPTSSRAPGAASEPPPRG
jgi:hypothetical protein